MSSTAGIAPAEHGVTDARSQEVSPIATSIAPSCRLREASRAVGIIGGLLLMTACNNQLPAPDPAPGQPLTEAQLYEQKQQRYQAEKDAHLKSNRRAEVIGNNPNTNKR